MHHSSNVITLDASESRDSAVGMATEGSEFVFLKGQEFSFLLVVQTGSGAHPAFFSMRLFLRGSSGRNVKLTTHLQLVLRSFTRSYVCMA
jgi:hypothetical protein